MKNSWFCLVVTVLLLALAPVAQASDANKYPVQFTVLSGDLVPGQGATMWVSDGQMDYYLDAVCLLHCYAFRPGTVMPGRFKQMHLMIVLKGTDDKGKDKEFNYNIKLKRWKK